MPYTWYKMCISPKMDVKLKPKNDLWPHSNLLSPSLSLELSLIDIDDNPFALQ
jgi:hypothetical protein